MWGKAQCPYPAVLAEAGKASGAGVVTLSLRREGAGGESGGRFWALIRELGVRVLPNTAGCPSVQEAVTTARMAREGFRTAWIKLEVLGNSGRLPAEVFGHVATRRLHNAG